MHQESVTCYNRSSFWNGLYVDNMLVTWKYTTEYLEMQTRDGKKIDIQATKSHNYITNTFTNNKYRHSRRAGDICNMVTRTLLAGDICNIVPRTYSGHVTPKHNFRYINLMMIMMLMMPTTVIFTCDNYRVVCQTLQRTAAQENT